MQRADILLGAKENYHVVYVFLWLLHLFKHACTCAFITDFLESSEEESPAVAFHCDSHLHRMNKEEFLDQEVQS